MGEGDFMPTGSHSRKADPKRAKAIKEGGKRADRIRLESEALHKAEEVPVAEDTLLKDLSSLNN